MVAVVFAAPHYVNDTYEAGFTPESRLDKWERDVFLGRRLG
jgi:hypothetical protein